MNNSGWSPALILPHPRPSGYILALLRTAQRTEPLARDRERVAPPGYRRYHAGGGARNIRQRGRAMALGRRQMWVRRVMLVVLVATAAGGAWAWQNETKLRARYASYRLKTAATDDERANWAGVLATRGEPGWAELAGFVRAGDPPTQTAALATFERYLTDTPDADPQAVTRCEQLLEAFDGCDEPGREAILGLLPIILKRGGAPTGRCREVIAAGLAMPGITSRVAAIRAAMNPRVKLRTEVLPLLHAAEAEVRRAALFAVAPATDDDPVIGDEDLFHWLHDPDSDVRKLCHDALLSRNRSESEISLGRRLTAPSAAVRLELVLTLRDEDDLPDPEPWLERLSRDVDPGVRAGAARMAVLLAAERKLPTPGWVTQLANTDPDPTVRRIVRLHQSSPVSKDDPTLRLIDGP